MKRPRWPFVSRKRYDLRGDAFEAALHAAKQATSTANAYRDQLTLHGVRLDQAKQMIRDLTAYRARARDVDDGEARTPVAIDVHVRCRGLSTPELRAEAAELLAVEIVRALERGPSAKRVMTAYEARQQPHG